MNLVYIPEAPPKSRRIKMSNKKPLALPAKKQMAEEQTPLKSLTASLDAMANFRIDRRKLYPLSEI